MEITIKMPFCLAPRLIDVRVAEGDSIAVGDILFSYESDGALMFEYAACSGTVIKLHAAVGRNVRTGDSVLTVECNDPVEFTL